MEITTVTGSELMLKKQLFVAGRFGGFETFGRSDIEKWLKEQRNAESPHLGDSLGHCLRNHDTSDFGWQFYLWRMFNGGDFGVSVLQNITHLEALQTHGAVVGESMQEHAENFPLLYKEKDLLSLFLGLANGRAYCLYNGFVFDFGGTLGVFTFTRSHGDNEGHITYSRQVWPMTWMESILMNWSNCSDEEARIKARNFLCDCLERQVQLVERKKAEADFDASVAVTDNGSKIVSADWVILSQSSGALRVYRKEEFTQDKLLRDYEMQRLDGVFYGSDPVSKLTPSIIAVLFKKCLHDGRFARQSGQYYFSIGYSDKDGCHHQTCFWCQIGENDFPEGGKTLADK